MDSIVIVVVVVCVCVCFFFFLLEVVSEEREIIKINILIKCNIK